MVLKRKLGPKSWPLEAVVGVGLKRRGSESLSAASWLQGHQNSARIRLQISSQESHDFRHDCPRFPPQSGFDRRRSCSIHSQECHKIATNRIRDERFRIAIVEFFHDVQPPSDSDLAGWTIAIIWSRAPRSRCKSAVRWFDASLPPAVRLRSPLDEDQPSDRDHPSKAFCWWRSTASRNATWRSESLPINVT